VARGARCLDGERAYRVLEEQLAPTYATLGGTYRGGTYPNLLDAHPPFQIDGNLGCTAGIAELLLQSHRKTANGEILIDVLPALPAAWAAEGRATGLKARGGFEISFEWKNGRVTRLLVDSRVGLPATIRYNDREVKVPAEKGKTQWN
jgi:alpha-L-fucosidase 2